MLVLSPNPQTAWRSALMEKDNKIIYSCMLSVVPFRTPSIFFSTYSFNNSEMSILSESGLVILSLHT